MADSVPNVRDGKARFKRIVVAFFAGVTVSVVAWFIANAMVEPEKLPRNPHLPPPAMNAFGFVFWATAISGSVALTVTLGVLNYRAQKKRQLTTP